MFNNIGAKIKTLAKIFFIVAVIIDVIMGIVLIAISDELLAIALPLIFVGPVLALICAWLLYGFGQLVENSDKLVEKTPVINDPQIRA